MQITIFSIWMTVLWSSILILLFYLLRTKLALIDICSVSGVIILYLFCMARMVIPVEFPWTKVITGGVLYNRIYEFFYRMLDIGITISVYLILLTVWFLGTAVILLHDAVRYRRIARYFGKMPVQRAGKAVKILDKLWGGRIKPPDIVQTAAVDTPCCTGILQKRIILPDKPYSENELYYILLHECSHLKNKDILTKHLINLLCALYWWNPCVYLLKKDLNQSMEIRCDAMVTKGLDDEAKSDYLKVVMEEFKGSFKTVHSAGHSGAMIHLFSDDSELLLERFKLVAVERNIFLKKGTVLAWVIAGCLLMLSYSFIIQTKYDVPEADIATAQDAYEVNSDNSYLIRTVNRTWLLHTQGENIPINEETAQMLIEDGFPVREECEK